MNFREIETFALAYTHAGHHLRDHVHARSREAFARGDAARDAITTPEALRARQEALRRFFITSLGGLPAMDTPLCAEVRGSVEGDGFRVEKLLYQPRPGHIITALLYLPHHRAERTPAVLFLHGHSIAGKHAPLYQGACQMLAQAGLIVLAPDPIGQGERYSYLDPVTSAALIPPGTGEHEYASVQCRLGGQHIARYFIHDAMRSVDYLQSRPEVDPGRIGVTGNSGGGTQTSMLLMCDPRLQAAAPGTFIMNRESYLPTGQPQDGEQIWPGFTAAGYDHEDLLLACAPRPMAILAVRSDFFPIEGTRRTVERARRFWELAGAPGERLELVEDNATHAYTPALARAAARFFAQHLLGQTIDPATLSATPFPPERLYVTRRGQVREEFPEAKAVFEANQEHIQALATARAARGAAGHAAARDWLAAQANAYRLPCEVNPRFIRQGEALYGLSVEIAYWWVQPGLANLGFLLRPSRTPGQNQPVTVALWDGGSRAIGQHFAEILRETRQGRAVLVLNLAGMGPLTPFAHTPAAPVHEFFGPLSRLADDLSWLGDSLAALHLYEMTRLPELLAQWEGIDSGAIRTLAHGHYGAFAAMAAALDPRFQPGPWHHPFRYSDLAGERYYDPYAVKELLLPGVLEWFDLDELTPAAANRAQGEATAN